MLGIVAKTGCNPSQVVVKIADASGNVITLKRSIATAIVTTAEDECLAVHNDIRIKVSRGVSIDSEPVTTPKSELKPLTFYKQGFDNAQAYLNELVTSAQLCRNPENFQHCNGCTIPGVCSNGQCSHGPDDGENYYVSFSTTPFFNCTDAVYEWYKEVHNYNFFGSPTGDVGHYTQVMWATTTSVGCAHYECTEGVNGGTSEYASIVLCRYDPPGNCYGPTGPSADVRPFVPQCDCSASCAAPNFGCATSGKSCVDAGDGSGLSCGCDSGLQCIAGTCTTTVTAEPAPRPLNPVFGNDIATMLLQNVNSFITGLNFALGTTGATAPELLFHTAVSTPYSIGEGGITARGPNTLEGRLYPAPEDGVDVNGLEERIKAGMLNFVGKLVLILPSYCFSNRLFIGSNFCFHQKCIVSCYKW